jgi:subtilisin family serine protease
MTMDVVEPSARDADDPADPAGHKPPQKERVSVLVHMNAKADRKPVRSFVRQQGGVVKYEYRILPGVINVRELPRAAVSALANVPGVVRIEEDAEVQAYMNQSAPLVRGLQSQVQAAGFSADGTGIRLCIVDTGIDTDNFMYSDRIDLAAGRDFVNGDNDPEDDHGHGSHVAGIAAGGAWSLTGCSGETEPGQGIAPGATLIGVKVLGADGSGDTSNVIAGIDYCADSSPTGGRADVINMSLGGGVFVGTCDSDTLAAAANNAVEAGVVVIAASGNTGITDGMGSPACGSNVVSVGATYDRDYPSCEHDGTFEFCIMYLFDLCWLTCSDTNPQVDQIGCYSNQGPELDVVAPGCITYSADSADSTGGLTRYCGTSMASPHVAGLAALLLDEDPTLTPADVRHAIRDGAVDLGDPGFDWVFGHGRIDVVNSLSSLATDCTADAECDDAMFCNGNETCVAGNCQPGTPPDCDDGIVCTTDTCDETSGTCLNTPSGTETCDDGFDNDCDNDIDCDDNDCSGSPGCLGVACGDGLCEAGEDCTTCPADCWSGDGGSCGNGVCEPSLGEDCVTCPADCNGKQRGSWKNMFCCGGGGGTNPVGCEDARCNSDGWSCNDTPAGQSCCGDGTCEGEESGFNCEVDCGPPPVCGDGTCDAVEDECSCTQDCGTPPASETGYCANGIDDDCDGLSDCTDSDCDVDPVCQSSCRAPNEACTTDNDCCSNKCRTKGSKAGTCS